MINIVFIIRSLDFGGAQRQLIELVRGLDRTRFNVTVLTFYGGGELRPELETLPGVTVLPLGKTGRWDFVSFLPRLVDATRSRKPDIVHGYLDVGNIFSLIAGRLAGAKVVFGVRASSMDFSQYDWTMGSTYRLSMLLSRFADRIITNSQTGLGFHKSKGLDTHRTVVIQNGIDTELYSPNRAYREHLRERWEISPNEMLIGLVGRLNPQKDHSNFIQAACEVRKIIAHTRFVCVGGGPEEYKQTLVSQAQLLGLKDMIWAGSRTDMPYVYNALDLLVLPSAYGEGFPNVVAEAMACGIPCVVTDVGDSALIVKNLGIVVPPSNSKALADGIVTMLQKSTMERQQLGLTARDHIIKNFSIQNLIRATQQVFEELAGGE